MSGVLSLPLCPMSSSQSTAATNNNNNKKDSKDDSAEIFATKFPIYALTYHQPTSLLILGGGGGPSRSGIPNGILLLRLQDAPRNKSKFALQEVGELRTGDEAVMSLSIFEDATECLVVAGVNDRCWLLEYEKAALMGSPKSRVSSIVQALNKGQSPLIPNTSPSSTSTPVPCTPLNLLRTIQSDSSPNDDGYLRVTRFTSTGRSFLAAGSDGCVREWAIPEMRLISKIETDGEILDTDSLDCFTAFITGTGSIHLANDSNSDKNKDKLSSQIILAPVAASTYKFVRFLKTADATLLIAVENVKVGPKSSKKSPRLLIFNLNSLASCNDNKTAAVSLKPVTSQTLPITKNCTCLTVMPDFIALGFADGSLLVISTTNLSSVFLLKRTIHPFPVTGLAIDSSKRVLLSSSADGTILIHQIPSRPTRNLSSIYTFTTVTFTLIFFVSLIVLLVAILSGKVSEIDDFDSFYKLFPVQEQVEL